MDILLQFIGDAAAFLQTGLFRILGFIFVLTIVVFFHELGHFIVARWCGVTVQSFSVGFGSEIFGFNDSKGTRWKLCWIPLGGYVKFIDDENAASMPKRDLSDVDDMSGTLQSKPLWQRASVVVAGPLASFLLGIVIFAFIFIFYGHNYAKPVVGEVIKNSPAEEAGFMKDDLIVSISGQNIKSFSEIRTIVQLRYDETLDFVVNRNGSLINLTSKPRLSETRDLLGNKQRLLGIRSSADRANFVAEQVGPIQAVVLSLERTYEVISTSLEFLTRLILGQAPVNQLSGPIGIADASGKVAELGIIPLIQWTAFLSIAIGFFNLFPIPMLDGGHLLLYAMEAIKGKPLNETTVDISFRIGMAILLSLMIFVTIIDVSRLLES